MSPGKWCPLDFRNPWNHGRLRIGSRNLPRRGRSAQICYDPLYYDPPSPFPRFRELVPFAPTRNPCPPSPPAAVLRDSGGLCLAPVCAKLYLLLLVLLSILIDNLIIVIINDTIVIIIITIPLLLLLIIIIIRASECLASEVSAQHNDRARTLGARVVRRRHRLSYSSQSVLHFNAPISIISMFSTYYTTKYFRFVCKHIICNAYSGVCTSICLCVCVRLSLSLSIFLSLSLSIYVYTSLSLYIYIISTTLQICIYIYTHIYTYTYMCVYYMYMYMCTCVYIYIYIYIYV